MTRSQRVLRALYLCHDLQSLSIVLHSQIIHHEYNRFVVEDISRSNGEGTSRPQFLKSVKSSFIPIPNSIQVV